MADPITNEQLALKVVEATTAVQEAHDTVVTEGKKLIAHMDDPNAHGLDLDATAEAAAKAAVDAHDVTATPHAGKFAEAGHDHQNIAGNAATASLAALAETATLADTATRAESAALADAVPWAGVSGKPADYPPAVHNHDAAYAAATHAHSPNDLSAVVPVAKGGTGNTTGNAVSANTATKLATARTISLTGGVTGSASFDGSGNVNLATTVAGMDAAKITSGTLPIGRGGTGRTDGSINGNAATATRLQTARTISLTGDVSGSASFDGSNNAAITTKLTVAAPAGPMMPGNGTVSVSLRRIPSGGTWAYFLLKLSNTEGTGYVISYGTHKGGVAAGGTDFGDFTLILAWRIA